jgi:RNA-directed DNA polymerase
MRATVATLPAYEWKDLDWRAIERRVFKLQKRIYQAAQRGDTQLIHKLQRLLMTSWSAKCLAVRKVTQDNRGKKTAGVDGMKSLSPTGRVRLVSVLNSRATPKPTRRVWIPKPGSPTDRRPLGIPTWTDKLVQEVMRSILEAYYDPQFSAHSHGFRPKRGCHTALTTVQQNWKGTTWFIEGDISKCFDHAS